MKIRTKSMGALLLMVTFLGSCAQQSDGIHGKNEPGEKYGTIVRIGRISSERLKKLGQTGTKFGEAGYRSGTLLDSTSQDGGAGRYAGGIIAGSLIYYGGQAFGARDSLEISLRMDDGTSRVITQKVKLLEHFGIGDRVKVVNDHEVTLVKSAP